MPALTYGGGSHVGGSALPNIPTESARTAFQDRAAASVAQKRELAEQRRQFDSQMQFRDKILGLLGMGEGGGGLLGMMQGPRDITQSLLGQVEGYGQSERGRIDSEAVTAQQNALAEAQSRGFGNSSFLASIPLGVGREREIAMQGLGDQLIGQKVGIQERGADREIQLSSLLAQLLGGLV